MRAPGPAVRVERVGADRLQLRETRDSDTPVGATREGQTREGQTREGQTREGQSREDQTQPGRLLGSCSLRRQGPVWVLEHCEVDPAKRRRGLGSRLVEAVHAWAVEEGASRVHLRLPAAGSSAGSFWSRLGYRPVLSTGSWTELAAGPLLPLAGPADTHALGYRLAGELLPGDLVLLTGPLGAGKTALAQGIGAGLGVRGPVTSPTFVLARLHPGPVPMLHVDVYRLRDAGVPVDLDDLELDEALQDSVTVVEWGEGLVEGLAESRLEVHLDRAADPVRTASVRVVGPRWSAFR